MKRKTQPGELTPQITYEWAIYNGAFEIRRAHDCETDARREFEQLRAEQGKAKLPFVLSQHSPHGRTR